MCILSVFFGVLGFFFQCRFCFAFFFLSYILEKQILGFLMVNHFFYQNMMCVCGCVFVGVCGCIYLNL